MSERVLHYLLQKTGYFIVYIRVYRTGEVAVDEQEDPVGMRVEMKYFVVVSLAQLK